MDMDEEEDVIVEEYDVVVCKSFAQLCILGHPLRPPWRPYDYQDVPKLRMKENAKRLEVDVPLNTEGKNYSKDSEGYKQIDKLTLRSQLVDQPAPLALGVIQDGRMLLTPIDMTLQMRPVLPHLNVIKKVEGEGGEAQEEEEEEGLKAVEVKIMKRETERQQQARLNSYAHLSKQEEDEEWKDIRIYMDNSNAADKVWERMMKLPDDNKSLGHISKKDYLKALAPSSFTMTHPLQQGAAAGPPGKASKEVKQEQEAPATLTPATLSDAAKAAFNTAMQALFNRHSVCSLQNVRQWVLEPRQASETLKAAMAAAREVVSLEDKHLHEIMTSQISVPLVCVRRMYVLKETGRSQEVDTFRKVVMDMLKEKESFRKQEVIEFAHSQGHNVNDPTYAKVMKELCVSRTGAWSLRNGADF